VLLVNQTKDLVLNLDTITALYIEKKSCSIKARTVGEEIPYHLGTYQSLDDCKKVLMDIIDYNKSMCSAFEMPLGGAVK
jgi:hypothetical protein